MLFFLLLLAGALGLECIVDVPVWIYVMLVVLFLACETIGAMNIGSGFHIKSVCNGTTSENKIALTFDDGPNDHTEKILDRLKEANVKAAFFLIGHRIEGHEKTVSRIFNEGHCVGNHSFEHNYWFDLKTKKNMILDLKRTEEIITSLIGKKPQFFRPPYGVTTPALAKAIRFLGYQTIGWSVRSFDTLEKEPEITLKRVKTRLHPGAIVLLHDTVKGTEFVLEKLLHELPAQGYEIVPLPDLIDKNPYA